jgi:hypothetical protein
MIGFFYVLMGVFIAAWDANGGVFSGLFLAYFLVRDWK